MLQKLNVDQVTVWMLRTKVVRDSLVSKLTLAKGSVPYNRIEPIYYYFLHILTLCGSDYW